MNVKLVPLKWKRNTIYDWITIDQYIESRKKSPRKDEVFALEEELRPLFEELDREIEHDEEYQRLQSMGAHPCKLLLVNKGSEVKYSTEKVKENLDWWDIIESMEKVVSSRYSKVLPSDKFKGKKKHIVQSNRQNRRNKALDEASQKGVKRFAQKYGLPFDQPKLIVDLEINAYSVREKNRRLAEINYKIEMCLYNFTNKEYIPTAQTIVSLYHSYMRDLSPIIGDFFENFSVGLRDNNWGEWYDRRLPLITTLKIGKERESSVLGNLSTSKTFRESLDLSGEEGKQAIKSYESGHLSAICKSLDFDMGIQIDSRVNSRDPDHIFPIQLTIQAKDLWSDMILRLLEASELNRICKRCKNSKCKKVFTVMHSHQNYCSRKGKEGGGCKKQQNQENYRASKRIE